MNRLRAPRDALAETLPAASVLITVGLGWLTLSALNFFREVSTLAELAFPVAALVLTGGLSCCVVYVGYRLATSEFDAAERWSITGWAFAGLAVLVLLQVATLAIRAAEGRPIGEPQFPLLVVGGVGALAGYGIGELLVDVRRAAAEAREARDGMAFTNSLLRHDVGNALQVIVGQVDVLRDIDDERAENAADRIESQVHALFELTDNAEAVTRVLTNEATPEPRDVTDDIDSAVATIRDSFPNATVETALHDSLHVFGTDALRPAISNVLHNAVEHTGTDPTVRVTTSEGDGVAVVRVADDGPGVPPSQRDEIFRRGVTSDGGSNGLGLHIVSTLIERSGGTIRVEDSELGGAAFVVELPLADD